MDHSKRPPTSNELEDAKSEKLAKVINLIKSKKAEKEAARNFKQNDKKEESISKRQGSSPFEAMPENNTSSNKKHEKEAHNEDRNSRTTHDTHVNDKKETLYKQKSTFNVPEHQALEENERNSPSPPNDHTNPKEKLKVAFKDDATKKEEENSHRQQRESAKDDIKVTEEEKRPSHKGEQNKEHSEHYDRVDSNDNKPNNEDHKQDAHKQDTDKKLNLNQMEHKVDTPKDETTTTQKDKPNPEDTQSKSTEKEKPEQFIPEDDNNNSKKLASQNEKDLHKTDIKQDDPKVDSNKSKPKASDTLNENQQGIASSAVYHDKKIPYHPQQKSIDIKEIKAQVNEVSADTSEPVIPNDMAEVTPTSIFVGYGIGQVDDEFGGLGLIGVFEGIASSANKSSISFQLHIFVITLFLTTWFMMHGRRR